MIRDHRRHSPGFVLIVSTLLFGFLLPGLAPGQEVVDLREGHLPRWRLEEDLRLGSLDGEHDAFVRPFLLKTDRQGRLFVLDGGLPALRVFDPEGHYLTQIGRKGQGPGEYTAPVAFGFLGDTVWVTDAVSRRLTFFGHDGRVLDDFTLEPEVPGLEPPQAFDVLGPDDFLVVVPSGPDRFFRGYGVGPVRFRQAMIRRNREGTRADTMATNVVSGGFVVTQADQEGFSVVPYRPIAQGPSSSYNSRRDEITEVQFPAPARPDGGEFRIIVRRRGGEVVADRRFRYRPLPSPPP